MRKILYVLPPVALVLCLVLVLMMTGMLRLPQSQPPTSAQSTPVTTLPTTVTVQSGDYVRQNMFSISLPEITETVRSADGVTLLRHTFQDVVLSSPNPRINDAVTLDLLRRMDVNASAVTALEELTQYYTPGTAWNTLFYDLVYSPTRIDSAVLSLMGTESVYSGSGPANNSTVCVNYYMPTGSVLTLSEVLSEESSSQDGLLQALLRVLAHNAEAWGLYEDFSESVIRYFPSYLQQDSIWFFSSEGLNICFAPYEIAPHTSGTVVATIAYEELTDILRSDLIPAQYEPVTGDIAITDLASAPLEAYTHFAECILQEDGINQLLTTDTILYDVRLELGFYAEDGRFLQSSTVFAANSLCADQAIRLCWDPGQQHLQLRCTTGGQTHCFRLEQTGDGSIALQPVSP